MLKISPRIVSAPSSSYQGGRACNVTTDAFCDWRRALAGRKDAAFKSNPKLDHGFLEGEGPGRPSDYAAPRNVAPYVVADIAAWIKRH